jgi:hypothetical protein
MRLRSCCSFSVSAPKTTPVFLTSRCSANRMAVRFQYECHDEAGQWYRSYGNELWEFTPEGLMARREASINDVKIDESERRYFGPRPESEYGLDIPLW